MQLFSKNIVINVDGTDTFIGLEKRLKEEGHSLSNWYINFSSKLDPNSHSPQVLVCFPSGKSIAVRFCDTIGDLMSRIDNVEGIPPYEQMLFFAGMLLDYDMTLSHYKISPGSTVNAAIVFRGQLKVKTTSGDTVYLNNAHYGFHISKVKDLIKDQKSTISIDQQRLVNVETGEELVDTRVLGSYVLRDMANLRLVEEDTWKASRNENMQLEVKIVATGDTITLDVVSHDTIYSVKSRIEKKGNYPVSHQVLYLPQKRLDDISTLADYYIMDQTTLCLVLIIPDTMQAGKEGSLQDQQQLTMNSEDNPPGTCIKRQKLSPLSS